MTERGTFILLRPTKDTKIVFCTILIVRIGPLILNVDDFIRLSNIWKIRDRAHLRAITLSSGIIYEIYSLVRTMMF